MYQLTQHKFWGVLALIISIMFVVGMVTVIGCGDDDDDDTGPNDDDDDDNNDDNDDDVGPPPATDVTVTPAAGTEVPSNQEFTLQFNEGVTAAAANGVPATGAGRDWKVTPFTPESQGNQALTITWTNRDESSGNKSAGNYTVKDPDTTPPALTAQTVNDGDADVDPAAINQGGLRFDFDEPISGTVDLTDEAGASLNWAANVTGQTATLTVIAGQELANETTYKVEIKVADGSNNEFTASITFVTKPKE